MLKEMFPSLNETETSQLIQEIKKKKELRELPENFVKEQLLLVLRNEARLVKNLSLKLNSKSKEYKLVIKLTRARLRRSYGLFRTEKNNLKELVEEYLQNPSSENLIKILESHSSTKERVEIYQQLYKKIFAITGKPKSILDLGCGINPFSIPLIGLEKLKELKYSAYDLNQEEIGNLKKLFEHLHQKNKKFWGEAEILDFSDFERLKKLKPVDLCFLFKITDIIDKGKGHKRSELVMKAIPARFLVVSFPTLTMSGGRMNHPRRGWIELMCRRLGYKFKFLEFSNEIFYVLMKEKRQNY